MPAETLATPPLRQAAPLPGGHRTRQRGCGPARRKVACSLWACQSSTTHEVPMAAECHAVSETFVRVNYSETDQMGVVYHARYLVWLDIARTEHLRLAGMSYRELEEAGLRLAVSEASVRYRQPARYDDRVRIRCWVRDLASRRIDFGYAVERVDDDRLLATAFTSLLALDRALSFTRLPDSVRRTMRPVPDPVSLQLAVE